MNIPDYPGMENFDETTNSKGRAIIEYSYRHVDGTVFTCTGPSRKSVIKKRNAWLRQRSRTYVPRPEDIKVGRLRKAVGTGW